MSKVFFTVLLGCLPFVSQNDVERYVLRQHANGQPYVVFFVKGADQEKVKEELYYDNGQLESIGHFREGREHGEFVYYWPDGTVKSFEYYENGLEEGEHYDQDESGSRTAITVWNRGVIVETQKP